MMMDRRYRRLSVFVAIAALLLAACTNRSLLPAESGKPISETDGASSNRVVLEYWHTYSELEEDVFKDQLLPLFEAAHPDIQIKAVRKDYTEQLKSNIIAAAADGNQPDVMRLDMIWVPELAKLGLLEELSRMEGFESIKEQFIGSLIETNRYKDSYYGLPLNANTKAAIFNMKLLREAGLNSPPRSFAQLMEAQNRLFSAHPNLSSIGICCTGAWGTLSYFWTFGGKLTDEQYRQATGYLDSSESIAAIRQIKDWYDQGVISTSIITGEPGTWDGLLKGELLMIDEAHWFYSVNEYGDHKELLKDTELGLFPNDANEGTSVIGGENLVLFNPSRNKEAAWLFIQWMMTEEPQRLMAATGLIPTIKQLEISNDKEWFAPYLKQLDKAKPRPPVSTWTLIDDEYSRMIERILTDEQKLEEAVHSSALKIDELLRNQ